eukprot:m.15256 g.15256  ORF g.15256 m.15256 type:complete len:2739 (-) comp10439_c0_seq1:193-8409(-)
MASVQGHRRCESICGHVSNFACIGFRSYAATDLNASEVYVCTVGCSLAQKLSPDPNKDWGCVPGCGNMYGNLSDDEVTPIDDQIDEERPCMGVPGSACKPVACPSGHTLEGQGVYTCTNGSWSPANQRPRCVPEADYYPDADIGAIDRLDQYKPFDQTKTFYSGNFHAVLGVRSYYRSGAGDRVVSMVFSNYPVGYLDRQFEDQRHASTELRGLSSFNREPKLGPYSSMSTSLKVEPFTPLGGYGRVDKGFTFDCDKDSDANMKDNQQAALAVVKVGHLHSANDEKTQYHYSCMWLAGVTLRDCRWEYATVPLGTGVHLGSSLGSVSEVLYTSIPESPGVFDGLNREGRLMTGWRHGRPKNYTGHDAVDELRSCRVDCDSDQRLFNHPQRPLQCILGCRNLTTEVVADNEVLPDFEHIERCVGRPGSNCSMSCPRGYRPRQARTWLMCSNTNAQGTASNDWDDNYLACADIDECESPELNLCRSPSKCVNTKGSFACDCNGSTTSDDGFGCRTNGLDFDVERHHDKIIFNLASNLSVSWSNMVIEAMTIWSHEGAEMPVPSHHEKTLSFPLKDDKVVVKGLSPGMRLHTRLMPTDGLQRFPVDAYERGTTMVWSLLREVYTNCGFRDNPSGSPVAVTAVQEMGRVYFSWTDQSMCESGFVITRDGSSISLDYSVTSSKNMYSKHQPRIVYDNLMNDLPSNNAPGHMHEYCVAAVNPVWYPPGYNSKAWLGDNCYEQAKVRLAVQFETRLSGAALMTDEAGGNGVHDVRVTLSLAGSSQIITEALTNADGEFTLHVKRGDILDRTPLFQLRFSKTSGATTHRFHYGILPIEDGMSVTLTHLDFSKHIEITDHTSVAVHGQVNVPSRIYTENDIILETGSDWDCPMKDVKVCFYSMLESYPLGCALTSQEGKYSHAVVINEDVYAELALDGYRDHEFNMLNSQGVINITKPNGVAEEPVQRLLVKESPIFNVDFEHTSTRSVTMHGVGGLCNRTIGTVTLKYAACSTHPMEDRYTVDVGSVITHWKLPAYLGVIQVSGVVAEVDGEPTTQTDAKNYFLENVQQLDLREPEQEPSSSHIRFEYHAKPTLDLQMIGSGVNTTCEGLTLIPERTPATLRVTVKEEYVGGICTVLPDNSTLTLSSKLGQEEFDGATPDQLALLRTCKDGCEMEIVYNDEGANAYVSVPVLTGGPRTSGDYTLNVHVIMDQYKGPGTADPIVAPVVVVGLSSLEGSDVIDVPTFRPLTKVFDPPGGLSTTTYANSRAQMRFVATGQNHYFHTGSEVSGRIGGSGEISLCAGLGASVCTKGFEASAGVQAKTEASAERGSERIHGKSLTLDVHFDYTTSDEPALAGRKSDMYLVPSIRMLVQRGTRIDIDDQCRPRSHEVAAWSIDDLGFAWRSQDNIESFLLAKIEADIETATKNLTIAIESNNTKAIRKANTTLTGYNVALSRWQNILAEDEKLLESFATDKAPSHLKANAAIRTRLKGDDQALKQSGQHLDADNLPMVPMDLFTGLRPFNDTEQSRENAESERMKQIWELGQSNAITFSGGGSTMSMTVARERLTSTETTEENSWSALAGGGAVFSFSGGAWAEGEVMIYGGYSRGKQQIEAIEEARTDEVSFTLGDPDDTDEFAIDVYMHPVYGTFMFHTAAGVSSCVHEVGTLRAVIPAISTLDPLLRPFHPHQPAQFLIHVANTGRFPASMELRADDIGAPGTLILVDGRPLPTMFHDLHANGTKTLIEVRRGPGMYDANIVLSLAPACDGGDARSELIKFKYAKVCPQPGILRYKQGPFIWNKQDEEDAHKSGLDQLLDLTVDDSEPVSWATNAFLNKLRVQYRLHGVPNANWLDAKDKDGEDFELKALKLSNYAMVNSVTAKWQLDDVADDVYDVRIRSECEDAPHGQANPDAFATLVLDRVEPTLFGRPQPADSLFSLHLNDQLMFEFTEPINCPGSGVRDWYTLTVGHVGVNDLPDLHVTCVDNRIEFKLPTEFDYSLVSGKTAKLTVRMIEDTSGNVVDPDGVEHDFIFDQLPEIHRKLRVQMTSLTSWSADFYDSDSTTYIDHMAELKAAMLKAVAPSGPERFTNFKLKKASSNVGFYFDLLPGPEGSLSELQILTGLSSQATSSSSRLNTLFTRDTIASSQLLYMDGPVSPPDVQAPVLVQAPTVVRVPDEMVELTFDESIRCSKLLRLSGVEVRSVSGVIVSPTSYHLICNDKGLAISFIHHPLANHETTVVAILRGVEDLAGNVALPIVQSLHLKRSPAPSEFEQASAVRVTLNLGTSVVNTASMEATLKTKISTATGAASLGLSNMQIVSISPSAVSFLLMTPPAAIDSVTSTLAQMASESAGLAALSDPGNYDVTRMAVQHEYIAGQPDVFAPRVFSTPQPWAELRIGGVIAVRFDEPLDCTPGAFAARVLRKDNDQVLDTALVRCYGSVIEISLVATNLSTLNGTRLCAEVTKVQDLVGNAIGSPVKWTFAVTNEVEERAPLLSPDIIVVLPLNQAVEDYDSDANHRAIVAEIQSQYPKVTITLLEYVSAEAKLAVQFKASSAAGRRRSLLSSPDAAASHFKELLMNGTFASSLPDSKLTSLYDPTQEVAIMGPHAYANRARSNASWQAEDVVTTTTASPGTAAPAGASSDSSSAAFNAVSLTIQVIIMVTLLYLVWQNRTLMKKDKEARKSVTPMTRLSFSSLAGRPSNQLVPTAESPIEVTDLDASLQGQYFDAAPHRAERNAGYVDTNDPMYFDP